MKHKILVLALLVLLLPSIVAIAKVSELCSGILAADRTPIYLGDDNHGQPVHLVVFYSQDYDHFATLFAISEYPQGSGDYYYFQPAGTTLRHNVERSMEWSGVSVTVTACSNTEVRYRVNPQPNA